MKKVPVPLLLVIILIGWLATGCVTLRPRNPVPEDLVQKAQIPGMGEVRIFANTRLMRTPNGPIEKARTFSRKAQGAAAKHSPCC